MTNFKKITACMIALCCLLGAAQAVEISFEVTGQGENRYPLAQLDFASERTTLGKAGITDVIRQDLIRTGFFALPDTAAIPVVAEPDQVNYTAVAALPAKAVVIGSVLPVAGGKLNVRFRLLDVASKNQLAGVSYTITPEQQRQTAHTIADIIYEKLSGKKGIALSQISYVVKQNGRFHLQVSDADGVGGQTIFSSNEPIISPAWSPDGAKIAYVSFEKRKPVIFIHELATGQRFVVAGFKGNNSAPAWSPDSQSLALALTYNGEAQIYSIPAVGGTPKRLTISNGIDTEPTFSPDGKWVYFTSDRGGSPQIYRAPASGGDASRITFEGGYNVSPKISPDGKNLVCVRQTGGGFKVVLHDLASGVSNIMTQTLHDEAPSFSPNGELILYATQVKGKKELAVVSVDGGMRQRLHVGNGDIQEPNWSRQ